ncbi:MAG TPA: DUF4037 domain-containing protein [Blastocatellia bacterium]|nr:DUF4037 domain-containing protein [Blastocatellia bacterium]
MRINDFIPGLELAGKFYEEAVRPILESDFPGVPYSAALIGSGSEILGFDTVMSTDHHWGPRAMVFLRESDYERHAYAIADSLRQKLPVSFLGYSTNYSEPDPHDNNVQHLQEVENGPVNHRVEFHTVRGYFLDYLGFDLDHELEPPDWLSFPEQKLRTITAGAVYHDEIGLQEARDRFKYYPRDVWLYLMACGWNRIGEEEHLMGRAGMVGDDLGSALISSRLVRDLMRLCFLMEEQYAPYPKWFGTAFTQLNCAKALSSSLRRAQFAETWTERERGLVESYQMVASMQNALEITEPLPTEVRDFFGRPFKVIALHGFAEALRARITHPKIQRIANRRLIGGIDMISDNTDILSDPRCRPVIRELFS